jgi:hypothetical protein
MLKMTAEELEKMRLAAIDDVWDIQFCDLMWEEAQAARQEVLRIIDGIFKKLQEIPAETPEIA